MRQCSIPDCDNPYYARDWCKKHYNRNRLHGNPLTTLTTIPGTVIQYYRDVVLNHRGDDCLIWPFNRNPQSGYANMDNVDGKGLVSRLVCIQRHGPPPTPKHDAAHSCGRGSSGCVSWNHLSWKTRKENCGDMVGHGTAPRGERCGAAKITAADALAIYALKGKMRPEDVALRYGLAGVTVRNIQRGTRWGWLTSTASSLSETKT